ncbi:MAG: Asp-tRNA(Asn)/Glu-tRNA(Gln) amidotransferase subunit GatC [Candidatus Aenigmarchaeota archaeon]|nr:Asp-tRNA(Asn)/Glu-tRNA(Gln) amidotransferase subunit GatC [Candidatus Aenigmarchaeota archaeon]
MDEEVIRKVAKIARLKLTREEEQAFAKDLESILDSFRILQKADPKARPAYHPVELKDSMREDVVSKGLSQEEALENARNREKGYFKGPKAIE